MYILDEENRAIDLNLIPDECDIHFWVYDAAKDIRDYHVAPLIMLESFYSPIVKLKFTEDTNRNPREYSMNIPAEYQLLIGDPTYGELELVPVTSLSKRGFMTFENNPLSSFRVKYLHVDVSDILPNVKWFMPKIQIGQLLCIPLSTEPKSPCIYIARDMPKSMECIPVKAML